MRQHYDVLFIGSGISALTCANVLAKNGKKVALLEQHYKAGGYMHCFRRFGVRFDTGAHYVGALGPGQPFQTILKYLNVYDPDIFTELDPDGFDQYSFPEKTLKMPRGYEELEVHLSENFPSEKVSIRNFLNLIQKTTLLFQTYTFQDKINNDKLFQAMNTSLKSVVEEYFQSPLLRSFFYIYCSLHGVLPEDTPFGMQAVYLDSFIIGSYGFKKGGDALTNKFVEEIKAQGGEVFLKTKVSKLLTQDKKITEVQAENGQCFSADLVISGIHPKLTYSLVDDPTQFSKAFLNRLEHIRESEALFCLYGITKNSSIERNKNYFIFPDSNPNEMFFSKGPKKLGAVFLAPAQREDHSKQLAFHAIVHGPIEWFQKWSNSTYRDRPEKYEELKKEYSENVLKKIDEHFPGFHKNMLNYVSSTPLTNLHFNGSPDGSSYGLYHSFENTGMKAWGPRTHLKNLLLTGQSTLFPGLLGSCISGLRSCGHVIGIKPIIGELRKLKEQN